MTHGYTHFKGERREHKDARAKFAADLRTNARIELDDARKAAEAKLKAGALLNSEVNP